MDKSWPIVALVLMRQAFDLDMVAGPRCGERTPLVATVARAAAAALKVVLADRPRPLAARLPSDRLLHHKWYHQDKLWRPGRGRSGASSPQ